MPRPRRSARNQASKQRNTSRGTRQQSEVEYPTSSSANEGRSQDPDSLPDSPAISLKEEAMEQKDSSSDDLFSGEERYESRSTNMYTRSDNHSSSSGIPDILRLNPPGRLIYDLSNFTPIEQKRIAKARNSDLASSFRIPRYRSISSEPGSVDFCFYSNHQEQIILQNPDRLDREESTLLYCTCSRNVRRSRVPYRVPLCEHIWHFQETILQQFYSTRANPKGPIRLDVTTASVLLPGQSEPISLYQIVAQDTQGLLDGLGLSGCNEDEDQRATQHALSVLLGSAELPSAYFSESPPSSPVEHARRQFCADILQLAKIDNTWHHKLQHYLAPGIAQKAILREASIRMTSIFDDLHTVSPGNVSRIAAIETQLRDLAQQVAMYDATYTGNLELLESTRRDLATFLLNIIHATVHESELFARAIATPFPQGGYFVLDHLARFADAIDADMLPAIDDLGRRLAKCGAPENYLDAFRRAIMGSK